MLGILKKKPELRRRTRVMDGHVMLVEGVLATVVALCDLARRSLGIFHCEHSRELILEDAWLLTRDVMRWFRRGYYTDHPNAAPAWLEIYALLESATMGLIVAGAEEGAMHVDACRIFLHTRLFDVNPRRHVPAARRRRGICPALA